MTYPFSNSILTYSKCLLRNLVSACYGVTWKPYSRLFVLDDTANWVLSWEARELRRSATRIGVKIAPNALARCTSHQSIFYTDQYAVLNQNNFDRNHRYGIAYFHGLPNQGLHEFNEFYAAFKNVSGKIWRIQVSNSEVYQFLMNEGWSKEQVHLIPIGINLLFFQQQTSAQKVFFRKKYGIPTQAIVLGSFQKDGEGWHDGNSPKLLKGPDIFLQVISLLKSKIPDLFVVLSGPSRGFVKAGLEKIGVQYKHIYLNDYREISELYQVLDVYIVASRIEGGPKAILESMASRIPLVTTKVGQAIDLVRHLENGWIVDVEDAKGLAEGVLWYLEHPSEANVTLQNARFTAEQNSYEKQSASWAMFFKNYVEIE